MRQPARSQRVVLTGALAVACAIACDTVLDIQDPTMRPSGGSGEAGEQASGAPNSGGTSTVSKLPVGGEAGTPTVTGGMGGVGGMGAVSGVSGSANTGGSAGQAGEAGQAGAAGAPECTPDALRCAGAAQKSPEICDATSHWTANTTEAAGDCPVLCANGKCTVCTDGDKRCSPCANDDTTCSTNQRQKCVDGAWANDGDECANYCDAGDCITPPSCPAVAGAFNDCSGTSCCNSLRVAGGSFSRDYDGSDNFKMKDEFPAEISPFLLDKFEVSVGRMRAFLNAYGQLTLEDGAGKSPHIAADPGWSTEYTIPPNKAAVITELKCPGTTWADADSANNDLPINCVSFNVAYAFCIWDGGRLPTEAEWNFAAAGGDEQRLYPWKAPSVGLAITPEYANYGSASPIAVGSKVLGNGRWGHSDLAGNVSEWTLDYFADYPDVCSDCMNATAAIERTERGGSYSAAIEDLLFVALRGDGEPTETVPDRGFRCARDLK